MVKPYRRVCLGWSGWDHTGQAYYSTSYAGCENTLTVTIGCLYLLGRCCTMAYSIPGRSPGSTKARYAGQPLLHVKEMYHQSIRLAEDIFFYSGIKMSSTILSSYLGEPRVKPTSSSMKCTSHQDTQYRASLRLTD